MNRVEIVWADECPHVDEARRAVRAALQNLELPTRWGEWNTSEPFAPRAMATYGSPTVLVDGVDVSGAEPAGAPSCRVYERPDGSTAGAPSSQAIVEALRQKPGTPRSRSFPWIETDRLVVWIPGVGDAPIVHDYFVRNREHHAPWSPVRPDNFFELEYWQDKLDERRREFMEDESACFVATLRDAPHEVVAQANFRNFVRGSFQACHLGYDVDAGQEGQGYMTEFLAACIRYVFHELGLHRIMANHLPENTRSASLLERLDFVREGVAKDYLNIAGQWRDHVLNALVNSDWQPQ